MFRGNSDKPKLIHSDKSSDVIKAAIYSERRSAVYKLPPEINSGDEKNNSSYFSTLWKSVCSLKSSFTSKSGNVKASR